VPVRTVHRPQFFATPGAFRRWFEAHHTTAAELFVGFYKKATGKPSITWPESVDEALSFGWIDGVRRSLSDEAYVVRFTPRQATSIWSAVNVARVAELEQLGKLTEAGRRAFAVRKAERTAVYSHERNAAAELSPADERRLRGDAAAAAFFDAQPPWYRRSSTHWVISAKREATRQRRLEQLIADSAAGRWVGPLRRPAGAATQARAERSASTPGNVKQGPAERRLAKKAPARPAVRKA